jgi:hypothetical protein
MDADGLLSADPDLINDGIPGLVGDKMSSTGSNLTATKDRVLSGVIISSSRIQRLGE